MIFLFRKIKPEDQQIYNEFLKDSCFGSEFCFANVFAWKDVDGLELFHTDEILIIKGNYFFFPPLVKGIQYQKALDFIRAYCTKMHFPYVFYGITEDFIPLLTQDHTIITSHPELDEYLYLATDLMTYPGKKFHAKRNLLQQFLKIPHEFKEYDSSMRDQIIALVNLWNQDAEPTDELSGILALLDHMGVVECFCDVILIEGMVQAFAIGAAHQTMGVVLFEKANTQYPGIYQAIVQFVAQKEFSTMTYINRQEDMGFENLRKSKQSYHPIGFIKKWQLNDDDVTQARLIYEMQFADSKEYIDYFFTKKRLTPHPYIENHLLKSVLYSRPQCIIFNGHELASQLVFSLSTHPHFEHQGCMHRLFNTLLQTWSTDTILVTLHPAIRGFYDSFGFGEIDRMANLPSDATLEANITREEIQAIYERAKPFYTGVLMRTQTDWDELFHELEINQGTVSRVLLEGKEIGYMLHDGEEIVELIVDKKTENRANNLVRILNLPLLLQVVHYVPKQTLRIIDPLIAHNNITIEGKFSTPIVLSIQEFTTLFFQQFKCLCPARY